MQSVPPPGPGQVQVRVTACGVCSWDIWTFRHGQSPDQPTPPGHEAVGRVHAVGAGVEDARVGELVAVKGGGFCDFCNIAARKAYPLSVGLLPDEHWSVEPVSCVVTALDHLTLPAGARVGVVGCGFMGLLLVQALSRCLLGDLTVADNNEWRIKRAKEMGAKRTVTPEDRRNLDCCIDCTGRQSGLALATELVRPGGTVVIFGWKREPLGDLGTDWHMKGLTVLNPTPFCKKRDVFPPAIRLIEAGHVTPGAIITHTAPLTRITDLLEEACHRSGGYIKGIVLTD